MPLGAFLKRRFTRILIPLILTFVIYLFVRHWTVTEWLYRVFTGGVHFHLWFMYALVGLYLTVPLFQPLFTTENGRKLALYYVVLWILSAVLFAYARRYYGWTLNPFSKFNFHYFFGFMRFLFVGGLLRRIEVTPRQRWISFGTCIVATILIYHFTKSWSLTVGKPNELFFENLSPFVVLQAISFFLTLKDIKFQSATLTFVAQHTYWIYLVHMLAMGALQKYTGLTVHGHTALNIVLITVGTFFLAFALSIPLFCFERHLHKWLRL